MKKSNIRMVMAVLLTLSAAEFARADFITFADWFTHPTSNAGRNLKAQNGSGFSGKEIFSKSGVSSGLYDSSFTGSTFQKFDSNSMSAARMAFLWSDALNKANHGVDGSKPPLTITHIPNESDIPPAGSGTSGLDQVVSPHVAAVAVPDSSSTIFPVAAALCALIAFRKRSRGATPPSLYSLREKNRG